MRMNKENPELLLILNKKVSWPSEAKIISNKDLGIEKTDHKVVSDIKITMIMYQGTLMKCLKRITILHLKRPG